MRIEFAYVRHGETLFNVIDRAQGSCDSPLTERGIRQARICAERLAHERFDRAFCSSSERAVDTAQLVLEGRDIPLTPLKGLKEMSFGTLEASRVGDAEMGRCWQARDFTPYGGEDEAGLVARIRSTFAQMVDQCVDGDHVLVVSHRGYFFYMLAALFGQNLDELLERDPDILATLIPNASVARISYDGAWHLDALPN